MTSKRLEILCAIEAIIWGFWLGNPWWDTFTIATSYVWMANLMPEWIWGWSVGLLGVGQLIVALWGRSVLLHSGMALINIFT